MLCQLFRMGILSEARTLDNTLRNHIRVDTQTTSTASMRKDVRVDTQTASSTTSMRNHIRIDTQTTTTTSTSFTSANSSTTMTKWIL